MTRTIRWTLLLALVLGLLVGAAEARAQAEAEPPTTKGAAAPGAGGATSGPVGLVEGVEKITDSDGQADGVGQLALDEDKKTNWLFQIFGPGMWPLWICSIALVALILERRRTLRPDRIVDAAMIERVADLVAERKMEDAQRAAAESPTVLGKAWAQGLREFSLGGTALAETLTNATVLAFKPLKKNLLALATLGVISPLFGLLGTVLGMIITFHQIAATGGADKAKLAGGIGLALFTTAGGLIVAIPAILGNRYFVSRLTGFAEQTEEAISRINYRYAHATAKAHQGDQPSDGK